MRRAAKLPMVLAAAVVVASCGGSAAPTTTADLIEARADEYALSAGRALEGTRFSSLGVEWLADLVIAGCERLGGGTDAAVELAALALEAAGAVPPSDPAENQILAEVLVAGATDVCPDSLASVTTTAAPVADPEDDYVRVVGPITDELGLGLLPDVLLEAGRGVCATLDAGAGPEQAVLGVAESLLGVSVDRLDRLEGEGGVRAADGAVLGSVLAAAAAYLCPEHGDTVMSYIAVLEARR